MDTRTKIRAACFDLCGHSIRVVSGTFDPLLAEHARRLQEIAEPGQLLVVIVTNATNSLLSQRARAELVAALSVVDYVVMSADIDDGPVIQEFTEQVVCKSRAS